MIETNLLRYGLDRRCARVRATDIPVLDLDKPGSNARARIGAEIERALRDDRGGRDRAGLRRMADLAAALADDHGVPVVDGVAAAVALAEGLAALGLATAKRGLYARPLAKAYSGHVRAVLAQAVTLRPLASGPNLLLPTL